ncbi:glycosyltransferase involved in cell wall biosynthesis [Azospirillum agricola]|uniref:glycosyltransferase family 4 protein n=1 Tax=Azospirillum agricola TaxID=1720247 RepID=UPI001AE25B5E|nr:glycosyltransferase family 4 protein [Azospirillum agricola]MBP2231532.1 glycosyltransferase involved in cell wall biosynthesis [Azospirillum agricola]
MRIAFHAPLKPPDHPVPSGDRQMARLLLRALAEGGHAVEVASALRSRDGAGDTAVQRRLLTEAEAERARLLRLYTAEPERRPDLWFSYHVYYKAPDLIGPAVAGALGIPYVVAEASRARKRLDGPWTAFAAAAESAIDRAALVLCLSDRDRQAVEAHRPPGQRVATLAPFLDPPPAPPTRNGPAGATPRLLTIAMMRPGDKLASYRLLAEALGRLADRPWTLDVIGDGPAADAVAALLAPFGERVRRHGALPPETLAPWYGQADLFLWPGLNEAFGMVYLESQAHGLPVVAVDNAGTGTVVRDGVGGRLTALSSAHQTAADYAAAVASLLDDPVRLAALRDGARRHVEERHNLTVAARRLDTLLEETRQ